MAFSKEKSKVELPEIRIILIGKTGAGKSTLGNALLSGQIFKSSITAESVTTFCASAKRKIKSRSRKYILKIIDTPGLKDNRLPEEETCGELVKCISLTLPGPHLFVIVVPIGRFTEEEFEVVAMLKREFGVELMNFALVVFTHGSKLEGTPIEEYLKTAPDALKQIVSESHNRYAVIGDKRDKNLKKSVQNIIDLIVDSRELRYYTNDMFKKADANKKAIMARLEEERNREMNCLRDELEELRKREKEKCSKEEKRIIKEEKQRKEEELKKRTNTSSEDMFDIKVVTDNSVATDTFAGTLLSLVGGVVATGVGYLTANAATTGAGMVTVAQSVMSLFSKD